MLFRSPGERRHLLIDAPGFPSIEAQLMGITWEFADGRAAVYTFAIGVSLEPYNERQATFRSYLVGWFLGVTLTMLLVVGGLLTLVLRPVRRLERQVREVEAGEPTIQVIDPVTDTVAWGIEMTGYEQYGRTHHEVRPMAFEANDDGSTKRIFVQVSDLNGFVAIDFATRKEVARVTLPQAKTEFETDAGRATPPSGRCSASPSAPNPSPTKCWSGRNYVHKRLGRNDVYNRRKDVYNPSTQV